QRHLFGQLADLLDHDLGPQLAAILGRDERHQLIVRVAAGGPQTTTAALAAGLAIGATVGAQQATGEMFGDLALAQPARPAEQQAMPRPAGVERGRGLVVDALLPGREGRHPDTCNASRCACSCATACAATASTGWLASMIRNRCGSASARVR